jgi:hypothetical protein
MSVFAAWCFLAAALTAGNAGLAGTSPAESTTTRPARVPVRERPIVPIPLLGDVARRRAEISGLTWCGDRLIILPQYPYRFPRGNAGLLYSLERDTLLAFLAGRSRKALAPQPVLFLAPGLAESTPGYGGYEAIVFRGLTAYLLIEGEDDGRMFSTLVRGHMAPDFSLLEIDSLPPVRIPGQAPLPNMSDESIVICDDRLITLYEANGANVNPRPLAHVFTLDLAPLGTVPSPTLEYRVTDATSCDRDGRFWIMNYFFPGERRLLEPARDLMAARDGAGPSHLNAETVERLVELRYTGTAVEISERSCVQFVLREDKEPRNWEGVARLANRGFLIATDRYPETILAFVPLD